MVSNQDRSLMVKGQRVDGRRHDISYQKLTNEHSIPMGQGLCQTLRIFRMSRAGAERDLDDSLWVKN